MNDQQPPPARDPQNQPLFDSPAESCSQPGLSDQEAFSLLAESMANSNGSKPDSETDPRPVVSAELPWQRVVKTRPVATTAPTDDRSSIDRCMPPVVPFRAGAPFLTELTGRPGRQSRARRVADGRHRYDWSTPVLVDDQWEVVDVPGPEPIHGQVTEIIDLTQVPPVVTGCVGQGDVAVVEPGDVDEFAPAAHPSPDPRSHSSHRIMPTIEEPPDARPLPPLVFLNTRGDIMPRAGETANGRNGDRFDNVVADPEGAEPPVATTTSASGVENMAESRGEIEAVDDVGRPAETVEPFNVPLVQPPAPSAIGVPIDPAGPPPPSAAAEPADAVGTGLMNAGDTQVLPPRPSSDASPAPVDGEAVAPAGDAPHFAAAVPSTTIESDPRLEELQRIFDQYSGPVIAVIASIAGDRRAIDEALQSTFEAVWKTVDTFDPEQPRGPWMFTLARRQAAEQVEVGRRLEQESKPGRYPVPSHRQHEAITVDKSWEAWEVRLAVDQLSPAEHDVLRLIHNEGLIHPEIAARLHTTVGAVKSHAYSGSHRLVDLLDHVIRPDAGDGLTVDQASALTWYLAGVADGSDLDADERSAVRRVQAQLASATAWINPDGHARERAVAFAQRTLNDPGPPTGPNRLPFAQFGGQDPTTTEPGSESTGRRSTVAAARDSTRRPRVIGGLMVVGLLAVLGGWVMLAGSSDPEADKIRRYQMQTSGVDGDATGVVEITVAPTGSRFEFEFGGLDASGDDHFYAAWLQSTARGGIVPLGTFSWQASGDTLVLSGPTWSDDYDHLVITRSEMMTQASIEDPTVLSVSIE